MILRRTILFITAIILLAILSNSAFAQDSVKFAIGKPTDTAVTKGSLKAYGVLRLPYYAGSDTNIVFTFDANGFLIPVYKGSGGGGAVNSVFGRNGNVIAQLGDYSSYYIPITGTVDITPGIRRLMYTNNEPSINTANGILYHANGTNSLDYNQGQLFDMGGNLVGSWGDPNSMLLGINPVNSDQILRIGDGAGNYYLSMGTSGGDNGVHYELNDPGGYHAWYAPTMYFNSPVSGAEGQFGDGTTNKYFAAGDYQGSANSTFLTVDDNAKSIVFNAANGIEIPSLSDNVLLWLDGTNTLAELNIGSGLNLNTSTGTLSATAQSADSTVFSTIYRNDTGNKNLRTSLALKLNYTDTGSMLNAYLRKSDTAGMLSVYLLKTQAATTYVPLVRTLTINGTTLDLSANRSFSVGTVTSVVAGTGLSGGTITTTGTVSMPNVGTANTYGSATQVPVITTDAQGRITGVVNTNITAGGSGTVTNVATGNGILGGPITSTGTLIADTTILTTLNSRRKLEDSLNALIAAKGTVNSVATGNGLSGGTINTSGTLVADTGILCTKNYRQKAVDSLNGIIAMKGVGSVTSVATGNGLTGGTITSSGTLLADTGILSTKNYRQKAVDSLNGIIATKGTVNSITAGTGLSGGTITNTGTISMPNTGTANTYANPSAITTDAQGRVTSVTAGSTPTTGTVTSVTAGNGLTGSPNPITATGTLTVDTGIVSTKNYRQKGVDSLNGTIALKVSATRNINTTAPITGGGDLSADRTIAIPPATTSANGYLTSTDWNTFNGKQSTITLTTTGTSGAATFTSNTLNIPQYAAPTTYTGNAPISVSGSAISFISIPATSVPANTTSVSATPSGSVVYNAAKSASTLVQRDASQNIFANNVGVTWVSNNNASVATVTLTVDSGQFHKFDGAATSINYKLPATLTLPEFFADSSTTATLNILNSAGTLLYALPPKNTLSAIPNATSYDIYTSELPATGTAGTYGSATQVPQFTTDAQGRVTAVSLITITPAVGSITGFGTGVAAWLATPSSANLATAVTDETGSGALVFANTPTLVTPVLGVATATSINKVAITQPATSATLTIINGKTLTATNSINVAGTDGTTETFPSTSATIARTDAGQTFTGNEIFSNDVTVTGGLQRIAIASTTTSSTAVIPAGHSLVRIFIHPTTTTTSFTIGTTGASSTDILASTSFNTTVAHANTAPQGYVLSDASSTTVTITPGAANAYTAIVFYQ